MEYGIWSFGTKSDVWEVQGRPAGRVGINFTNLNYMYLIDVCMHDVQFMKNNHAELGHLWNNVLNDLLYKIYVYLIGGIKIMINLTACVDIPPLI